MPIATTCCSSRWRYSTQLGGKCWGISWYGRISHYLQGFLKRGAGFLPSTVWSTQLLISFEVNLAWVPRIFDTLDFHFFCRICIQNSHLSSQWSCFHRLFKHFLYFRIRALGRSMLAHRLFGFLPRFWRTNLTEDMIDEHEHCGWANPIDLTVKASTSSAFEDGTFRMDDGWMMVLWLLSPWRFVCIDDDDDDDDADVSVAYYDGSDFFLEERKGGSSFVSHRSWSRCEKTIVAIECLANRVVVLWSVEIGPSSNLTPRIFWKSTLQAFLP